MSAPNIQMMQGGATVARVAHNHEVAGSTLAPAPKPTRRIAGPCFSRIEVEFPRGLSRPQADTLAFVGAYLARYGRSPDYSRIARAIRVGSRAAAFYNVHRLIARGFLAKRARGGRRDLVLVARSAPA